MANYPKYCKSCGVEFDYNNIYCPSCGSLVDVVHKCLACRVAISLDLFSGFVDEQGKPATEIKGKGYLCSRCAKNKKPSVGTFQKRPSSQAFQKPPSFQKPSSTAASAPEADFKTKKPEFSSQIPKSDYYGGNKNCLNNAESMAGQSTRRDGQFVVAEELRRNKQGHIKGDQQQLQHALDYVQLELQAGRRVVIGVSRVGDNKTPNAKYGDYATNHFVTVYRMRISGGETKLYFRDPGTAYSNRSLGILTIDSSNVMIGNSPYSGKTYEMTVVRKNRK